MVVRLSISDVSLDGYGGVDFELHLFNGGTVPYDCMSVRAQTITEVGSTPPVSSFAGSKCVPGQRHPSGEPGEHSVPCGYRRLRGWTRHGDK